MAEYNLSINLIDNVSDKLDALMSKISSLGKGNATKGSFGDWLSGTGAYKNIADAGRTGEKIGDALGLGIDRGLQKRKLDRQKFFANMSMLAGPVLNPGGGLSTMFAGRQVYSALNTQMGQTALAGTGLGSGAATALLIGGATAVGFSLKGLQAAISKTVKSFDDASHIYSKALMSGLGVSMTTKRGAMADIMGVSENEVYRFSNAMKYLDGKISMATDTISKNVRVLTAVSWEWKVLELNVSALSSKLAALTSGTFMDFLQGMNLFAQTLASSAVSAEALKITLTLISDAIQVVAIALGGLVEGFQLIGDTVTWLIHLINNLIAEIPGAGKFGFKHIDTSHDFDGTVAGAMSLRKQAEHLWNSDGSSPTGVPVAATSQKRWMNPSQWEKMGLVMGGGLGGGNSIEKNTKETVKVLKSIHTLMKGGKGGGGATTWTSAEHAVP